MPSASALPLVSSPVQGYPDLDRLKQQGRQTTADNHFSDEYLSNETPPESESEIDTSEESSKFLQSLFFLLLQICFDLDFRHYIVVSYNLYLNYATP
ncbi:MAG: hypothetical protein QNJ55_26235 [Xenococcus sp. MO_188.B8]|nr:hypothetical protein [Xenococcus sp. MO_188.B8]